MTEKDKAVVGVFGAYGAQGGAISAALESRGVPVRYFGTKPRPSAADHESVQVDLGEPAQVQAALDGLEAVSLTIPLVYDADVTRGYAENVATAAKQAGVKRIVFNANTRVPARETEVAGFETRRVAEQVLSESGVPLTVVRPAMYLENLLAPPVVEEVMTNGVLRYPVPASTPVAWISLADLGQAVAAALVAGGHSNSAHDIGGEDLTGPQLADYLGTTLDRPVRFETLDPTHFEGGLAT